MISDKAILSRVSGPLGRLAGGRHGGAVLLMIKHWGGTKRYVGILQRGDSPLVQLIGQDAADALAAIVSDMDISRQIDIPSRRVLGASLKAAILDHAGTTRETALALGCTERYVRDVREAGWTTLERRARRAKPVDERQRTIFEIIDPAQTG